MKESKRYEPGSPEIAEKENKPIEIRPELRQFFESDAQGRFLNNLYTKTTDCPGYEGAKIPPLRLGKNEEDIMEDTECCRYVYPDYNNPIYDESGMDIGYTEIKIKGGLKEYIIYAPKGKPPLYVFDNHNHALFAWQECKDAGLLSDESVLLRFDDHLDMSRVKPHHIGKLSRNKIRENFSNNSLTGIDIENFTRFAFEDGLINEMLFIHGRLSKKSDEHMFNKNNQLHDLNADEKFKFLSPVLFDKGLDGFKKSLKKIKDSGKDIILDIDFDVFTKDLSEDKTLLLEQAMREAINFAQVITCATSPGYGNHTDNTKRVKKFVKNYLENKIDKKQDSQYNR
ncbi:MAG: hypothetical protein GF349_02975 [Candidatus Magasanikbacteria bacterium]|nr:hypothetical protein [Candidatus Magasanikbacteria bacterium]